MDIFINATRVEAPPGLPIEPTSMPPIAILMKCLGFPETGPPIADFLRQAHQLEGSWLVCEPIYWEAGHNDAIVMATARMLQLPQAQSHVLFEKVQAFLVEEGLSLYFHDAYTWLIR